MNRLPLTKLLSLVFSAGLIIWLFSPWLPIAAQENEAAVQPVISEELEEVGETENVAPIVSNVDEITESTTPLESITLTAIPPRLGDDDSLTGNPGDTIQTEVRVRNNTPVALRVRSSVEDFMIGADGKTPIPIMADTDSRWSLASWITLVSPNNQISALGDATIPVIIQIPQDARPGGRYAMITHEPVPGSFDQQAGEVASVASINQRVGTLVYFRVNGDITENAVVRNINIPFLTEFGPVPVEFEIENLSDIHIQPKATVKIKNWFGQVVDTFEIDSKNVFPFTTRDFEGEWDRVWGIGRYTAEISAAYGSQGKVAIASQAFWLIPYTLIISILFGVLAIVGIVIAVRRHLAYRNNLDNQHISLLEDRIRQLEDELHRRD